MGLKFDQEFINALGPLVQTLEKVPKPELHDVGTRRARLSSMAPPAPDIPEDITFKILHISTQDGFQLPIYHFKKNDQVSSTDLSAAVIHAHGGGLIAFSPDISIQSLANVVSETGVQAFSVDYRLAPEHRFPTAIDDCWACFTWLHSNADTLRIDPTRIAVMGESAGGGLAAALVVRARDTNFLPPIAQQILSAPMLDDRTSSEVPGSFNVWDGDDNLTAWTAYLGRSPGGDGVPATAAPGRITSAAGLAPLYMETTQFDLYVRENSAYVQKFIQADVEVEFHLYPGLPHGFDGLAPTHQIAQQVVGNKMRVLKRL